MPTEEHLVILERSPSRSRELRVDGARIYDVATGELLIEAHHPDPLQAHWDAEAVAHLLRSGPDWRDRRISYLEEEVEYLSEEARRVRGAPRYEQPVDIDAAESAIQRSHGGRRER